MAFVGGRRRRSHKRRATRSRLGKAFSGVESGFGAVLGTVGLRKPVNAVARTVRLSRGGRVKMGGTMTKCPYSSGGKRRRKHRTRKHKRKCH
jgi:hypothetical protein